MYRDFLLGMIKGKGAMKGEMDGIDAAAQIQADQLAVGANAVEIAFVEDWRVFCCSEDAGLEAEEGLGNDLVAFGLELEHHAAGVVAA